MSKTLPAPDPIDVLLEREVYRIRQMRDTLRLRGDGFDRLYMPVLRKFGAYAHLLPASEKHHHDGQGGLLSHSLEVSVGATRASSAFLYGHRVSPKYQDHVESQWRLAIAFSGLLHDCGKLFTGMKVTDASGLKKWNPYRLSLMDWLEIEKVDRYRILWEKSRFGNHEMLGAGLLHFFISEEIQNFLTSHDQSTWKSITETVAGHNDEEKFGALVKKEDHYSVATDLALNRKEPELSGGQRPEAIVIQIMRDLLSDPRWSVNVPGSRLWHIEDSVHLVWKSAAADIAERLIENRIVGVPRDAEGLSALLIERGIAIPRKLQNGEQEQCWKLELPGVSVPLNMLRLTPGVLPDLQPSVPVEEQDAQSSSDLFKRSEGQGSVTRTGNLPPRFQSKTPIQQKSPLEEPLAAFFERFPKERARSFFHRNVEGVHILHIACADFLGIATDVMVREITQKEWHVPDPRIPNKTVRRVSGQLGILMKSDIGSWLTTHFDLALTAEHPLTVIPAAERTAKPKKENLTARSVLNSLPRPDERPPLSELQKRSKVMPGRKHAK